MQWSGAENARRPVGEWSENCVGSNQDGAISGIIGIGRRRIGLADPGRLRITQIRRAAPRRSYPGVAGAIFFRGAAGLYADAAATSPVRGPKPLDIVLAAAPLGRGLRTDRVAGFTVRRARDVSDAGCPPVHGQPADSSKSMWEHGSKAMRVMLVDDDPGRRAAIESPLRALGHEIVGTTVTSADLYAAVKKYQPDVILIDVDAPSRDTLESLGQVSRSQPRPIVLFSNAADSDTIRRAVQAGVTSYVVDGLNAARLRPILEVAIARFQEFHSLKRELEETKSKLADRRDIEKAKGLLMKRRQLEENAAYELLRRMAMDRNLKLGDAARSLIAAAELL